MDNSIKLWVNDQLHAILRLSDRNLVDYIMALAQKAKTSQALFTKLREAELPNTPATHTFCSELFSKVHPKPSDTPSLSRHAPVSSSLSTTYTLVGGSSGAIDVEDWSEDEDDSDKRRNKHSKSSRKKKKNAKKKRKKDKDSG